MKIIPGVEGFFLLFVCLFACFLPPVCSDQIRSDQSLSRVRLFATPWIAARQVSLSITSSRSSLRLTSTESVMPSSHLILFHPLLLLPPIPPSIRVFSNESTLRMRWPSPHTKKWKKKCSVLTSWRTFYEIKYKVTIILKSKIKKLLYTCLEY